MNLLDRIAQLAGQDVADTIQAECGGREVYIPAGSFKSYGASARINTMPVPPGLECRTAAPSPSRDAVEDAIEDGFQTEMRRLMAGALQDARTPEHQREWLSTAQQLLVLRQLALAWHAAQKTAGLVPTAPPPSAA